MSFQITGLPLSQFSALFAMSDEALASQGAIRVTADEQPGFPCRVSLQDAEVGEKLILLNYEHLPVATPYRSRHAIYVRESATEAHLEIDEVPQQLRPRLLSLRGFDSQGMMKAAEVVPGTAIENLIEQMFSNPAIAFLHVHNAKWGCFAARVDRTEVPVNRLP
ncbi:DUF1203 domain-containing protein [Steroidobacter flavus]|uniref:DUF1203 domain-containing protein n=1 Tax=Steroidobacter flavus TaxID=1842136 RepID=A0ABV8SUM2_9GAMM